MILAGLGMAAVGFAGRYILRQMPNASMKFAEAVKNLPKFDAESMGNSKYYKGGFESKMTKREASLILGISPTANKSKVWFNYCYYKYLFSYSCDNPMQSNSGFKFLR